MTEEEFLKSYDPSQYQRPSVTVDAVVLTVVDEATDNYRKLNDKKLKVLLIKRGQHPCLGRWALPGGFLQMHESLSESAYRELREETGVTDLYLEQLYTFSDVNRDPRTRVISTAYMALVNGYDQPLKASDDAQEAAWFNLSSRLMEEKKVLTQEGYVLEKVTHLTLSCGDIHLEADVRVTKRVDKWTHHIERKIIGSTELAFDHAIIILYALERLRAKLDYSDIAFNLLPEYFTLTELQQVYEVILDQELLTANFRRKIGDKVLETNKVKKDAGHRPSKLYQYKNIDENLFY